MPDDGAIVETLESPASLRGELVNPLCAVRGCFEVETELMGFWPQRAAGRQEHGPAECIEPAQRQSRDDEPPEASSERATHLGLVPVGGVRDTKLFHRCDRSSKPGGCQKRPRHGKPGACKVVLHHLDSGQTFDGHVLAMKLHDDLASVDEADPDDHANTPPVEEAICDRRQARSENRRQLPFDLDRASGAEKLFLQVRLPVDLIFQQLRQTSHGASVASAVRGATKIATWVWVILKLSCSTCTTRSCIPASFPVEVTARGGWPV